MADSDSVEAIPEISPLTDLLKTLEETVILSKQYPITPDQTQFHQLVSSLKTASDKLTSFLNLIPSPLKSAQFSRRVIICDILSRTDGGEGLHGQEVTVGGWVKTGRIQGSGRFAFLQLNDGSCPANLQAVVESHVCSLETIIHTGTCVYLEGFLKETPQGRKQKVELKVNKVWEMGSVNAKDYPIPKTPIPIPCETLRDEGHIHLRQRTQMIGAAVRIRDKMGYATEIFFHENDHFIKITTPTITTIDCEGAGDMFQVGIPPKDGKIDHFFGRQAFLTVSGQLQLESYACALGNVYTFGPTFRAEHSHTSRHLAEFWMVEAEMAFADLQDVMNLAEAYVKFICQYVLKHCLDDMEVMVKNVDKTAIEHLKLVSSTPFERISYTEAVKILENPTDKKFEKKVEWGEDLSSEHERYLTEVRFKKPVIVYNYPKGFKAFYMRSNDDKKTVAAMDVLVPKVGELIGGSQREERLDVLEQRIKDKGLSTDQYKWYLDLRRHGTVKHSGFGLGFDRMVQFTTGLDNIRDVIPYPRYPGRADL